MGNKSQQLNADAHAVRASQIHARLLSTIDALDTARAQHANELKAESKHVQRLRQQIESVSTSFKLAQDECEDMREAVNELVDLDPLEPMPFATHNQPDEEALRYAAAIITSLRTELDNEKSAHLRTKLDATYQISELHSRIARREAELETLAGCSDTKSHPTRVLAHQIPLMSTEDALKILELGAARNKAVEVEVKELTKRLDRARASSIPQVEIPDISQGPSTLPTRNSSNGTPLLPRKKGDKLPPTNNTTIINLDRMVEELGQQIDQFAHMKAELIQSVEDEKLAVQSKTDGMQKTDSGSEFRSKQGDCLAASFEAALRREKALKEENERLRQLLDEKQPIPTANLLDNDGEMSMELATPLLPSTILEHSIPLDAAFPTSAEPSPLLSASSPPAESPLSNVQRLERELAAEHEKLITTENAAVQLRQLLEGLRLQQ